MTRCPQNANPIKHMASTKKKAAKKVTTKKVGTQKAAPKTGPKTKTVAQSSPPKAKAQSAESVKPKTKTKAPKPAAPAMTYQQVMAALKANGSAQTVKTFRNHGVTGEMYGVRYAFLKTLHKQIKTDQALAEALWQSGIHDARVFACWVADAQQTTAKLLNAWAKDVDNHVLAYEVASLAQDCDFAATLMGKWIAKKDEWTTTMGWSMASRLATQVERPEAEGGLSDKRVGELLDQIKRSLHAMPNRTRHTMNSCVMTIGCRSQSWRKKAHAAAKAIGKIEVDYGATTCKVNDASTAIDKSWTHYEKKGKVPTDGTAGQRRRHC